MQYVLCIVVGIAVGIAGAGAGACIFFVGFRGFFVSCFLFGGVVLWAWRRLFTTSLEVSGPPPTPAQVHNVLKARQVSMLLQFQFSRKRGLGPEGTKAGKITLMSHHDSKIQDDMKSDGQSIKVESFLDTSCTFIYIAWFR